MNKTKFFYTTIFFIFFISLFFVFNNANAGPLDNVSYPIPELGNCGSVSECMTFCDISENQIACIDWAASKKMVSEGEARKVRDMNKKEEEFKPGPGGCISPRECDAYCRVEENLRECMDYSVRKGYMPKEEADGIIAKTEKGGPGGCKSKSECENFCKNPENADECLSFVVDEGKITKEEAEFMKERMKEGSKKPKRPAPEEEGIDTEKVQTILKEQTGPGGCTNMGECQKYCMDFNNAQECMEFAVKHQITKTPQDLERIKKISQIKSGPGGCTGPNECDAFCSKEENRDECFRFTKENQLMSEEEIQKMEKEIEIVKKLKGGEMVGPGGCKGPEECNAFCSNSSNIEECINFSGQHGMLNKNTVQQMMGKTQEARQKLMEVEEFKRFKGMEQNGEFKNGVPGEFMKFGPPPGGFENKEMMPPEATQMMKPDGFVPRREMIPQGNMIFPPQDFQKYMPDGRQGTMPPEGFSPPEGFEKFMQQYQIPQEGNQPYPTTPPSGSYPPPPSGTYQAPPSGSYSPPPSGTYQAPPSGSYPPPPSGTYQAPPEGSYPTPTNTTGPSSFNSKTLMGTVLEAFSSLLDKINK
ncbi:MAG: hypothetical protein WC849_00130 [Candidatus Paceibacterota bacterium]